MKTVTLFLLVLVYSSTSAQTKIDTTFNFQTDPVKKLSIYIPSSYSSASPNGLMLGLHPYNTARWNAKSWRDTLIVFAEENNLILLCPDGGSDGQVDDAIDLAFTSAMLDSIQNWYNIDTARTFCMGFSWGGKTTYSYGLQHPDKFCGYMPIGSTLTVREVAAFKDNIKDEAIYIIHGQSDALSTRFTPIKKAMEDNGGIVNSFVHNAGHTIDFPNRNEVMKTAFVWLDSVCTYKAPIPNSIELEGNESGFLIYPNPISPGTSFNLQDLAPEFNSISIIDMNGKLIFQSRINEINSNFVSPSKKGNYLIELKSENKTIRKILVVQ